MKFWKIKSSLVVDSELCLKWWTFDMLWRTVICWLFKVYKFTWDNGRVGIENEFDNLPLLVVTDNNSQRRWVRKKRFLFEEMWSDDHTRSDVYKKLNECAQHLSDWNKSNFGHVPKKLQRLRSQLVELHHVFPSKHIIQQKALLQRDIDCLLLKEETLWQQRSRVSWLQKGDHNTHYFHNYARQRVNDTMNDMLISEFIRAELEATLAQMIPTKALGPDGMPFNHTLIAIIPKIAHPSHVSDYRPIILCNILYKLVAKTLANRLKVVLPHVISSFQSAFVPNLLITDNIIAAFETMHAIKRRGRRGRKKIVLKLDMSKAYDQVEWTYLATVMARMGFHVRWVSMILDCISSVSYSVLCNGFPFGHIVSQCGLHQGDPLSPYLFLICAEGFSALIRRAQLMGSIHGVAIARGELSITHLLFVDDKHLGPRLFGVPRFFCVAGPPHGDEAPLAFFLGFQIRAHRGKENG
ncbi:unnamed protein product [Prunus armeniaca]|uniref:Reverse transcriptase domain-containing protein n=1 Tax=Prunus armeniaca TaxID=36596 RepID=A0A6J5VKA5_PRUAR|nr:unnamed protein product [Prunus armeniaca]